MTAKNTDGLRGNHWAAVRARARTLLRWGLAVAERVPLTFLGLLALPLLFWVLALGGQRLGEAPPGVREAVAMIRSVERLEQLAARALKAATWQEVLAPN
jgi:hypothetical protein